MLLSDVDIRRHLQSDDEDSALKIVPLNQQDIQPGSIDLHLGPRLLIASITAPGEWISWDLREQPMHAMPGDFILAHMDEWLEIPPKLAGEVVGKSSRAREGWQIHAAGYFDPGWKGKGTLEITMYHPAGGDLKLGMPICQIRFHVMSSKPTYAYGSLELSSHYNLANTVEPSFTESGVTTPPLPVPGPVGA